MSSEKSPGLYRYGLTPTFVTPHAKSVYWAGIRAREVLAESGVDTRKLGRAITAVFALWKTQFGGDQPVANDIDLAFRLFTDKHKLFLTLVHKRGLRNVFLTVLANEIDKRPDVDPSSVIRALSLCLDLSAAEGVQAKKDVDKLFEGKMEFAARYYDSRRYQQGLKKGSVAGGAAMKKKSETKRQQCIDIDTDVLRNPVMFHWSLKKRTNFAYAKMAQSTPAGKRAPAWATVKEYLKPNKNAFLKSSKK